MKLSQQQRRERGYLIETFKTLKGFERTQASRFFKLAKTDTRGHTLKLFKPRLDKSLKCRSDYSSQRVINQWNTLPKYLIGAKSTFKKRARQTLERYGVFKGIAYHFPSNCKCKCIQDSNNQTVPKTKGILCL